MKKNDNISMRIKKSFVIIIASCVFVLALLLALLIPLTKKNSGETKVNLTAAFVGLPKVQAEALEKELSQGQGAYTFVSFDNVSDLDEKTIQKFDLVFALDGAWTQRLENSIPKKVKDKAALPQKTLKGFTRSMTLAAGRKGSSVTRLPVLLDSQEILFDQILLKTTKTKSLNSWQEIEKFASASGVERKIVFAGKDSRMLCGVLTMLTESISGKEAVEKIRLELLKDGDIAEKVTRLSDSPDAPLYAATHTLARWQKEGLLNQSVYSFENRDVQALMYARNAAVVFTTLTRHRAVDYTTISRYVSLPVFSDEKMAFVPSFRRWEERALVSPYIVAVPLSQSKVLKDDLEKLTDPKAQEALSKETGLAPVLANCRTPDLQADDLRYWVAATGEPLKSLADSAFYSDADRDAFAKTVVAYIRQLNY